MAFQYRQKSHEILITSEIKKVIFLLQLKLELLENIIFHDLSVK